LFLDDSVFVVNRNIFSKQSYYSTCTAYEHHLHLAVAVVYIHGAPEK